MGKEEIGIVLILLGPVFFHYNLPLIGIVSLLLGGHLAIKGLINKK